MFYDMFSRTRLNIELSEKEAGSYLTKAEKKALRRAEEAEEAFRSNMGYPPKSFWKRLILKMKRKSQ